MMPGICLAGVILFALAGQTTAEDNQKIDCDSGWRSISKNVMSGEGQASISAQCRSNEKPCPPRHELVRRAKLVANAYALADIQAKVRSEVSHKVVVENGVGSDRLTIKIEGEIFQVKLCNSISNDIISALGYGEIQ